MNKMAVSKNPEIVYCDTCIYIDNFEDRKGKWINWGDMARRLFNRVESGELKLVISDHLEEQIKILGHFNDYQALIQSMNQGNIIKINVSNAEKMKANHSAGIDRDCEYEDALHAELALKGCASVFITRNLEDFRPYMTKFKSICQSEGF